jgi:WD40 repeat protein
LHKYIITFVALCITSSTYAADGEIKQTRSQDRALQHLPFSALTKDQALRNALVDINLFPYELIKIIAAYTINDWRNLYRLLSPSEEIAQRIRHLQLFRTPDDKHHVMTLRERYCSSEDLELEIWDIESGKKVYPLIEFIHMPPTESQEPYQVKQQFVNFAVIAPQGNLIGYIPANTPQEIHLFDTYRNTHLTPLQHPQYIRSCTFSPQGSYLISTCKDQKTRLWSPHTAQLLGEQPGLDARYATLFAKEQRMLIQTKNNISLFNLIKNGHTLKFALLWSRDARYSCPTCISPQENYIVTAEKMPRYNVISLLNANSGERLLSTGASLIPTHNTLLPYISDINMTQDEQQICCVYFYPRANGISHVQVISLEQNNNKLFICKLSERYHAAIPHNLSHYPAQRLDSNKTYLTFIDPDEETIIVRRQDETSPYIKNIQKYVEELAVYTIQSVGAVICFLEWPNIWSRGIKKHVSDWKESSDRMFNPHHNLEHPTPPLRSFLQQARHEITPLAHSAGRKALACFTHCKRKFKKD